MNDLPKSPSTPRAKKLSPGEFLLAEVAVSPSVEEQKLPRVDIAKSKHFEIDASAELGRVGLQEIASGIESPKERLRLSDLDFANLGTNDASVVAAAIGKNSDQGSLPVNPAQLELEHAVRTAKDQEFLRHEKMQAKMRASIGGSYSFLEKSTLEKLQGQVADLVAIRTNLSGDAREKAMGSENSSYDRAQREIARILSSQEAVRSIGRAKTSSPVDVGVDFSSNLSEEALKKAMGFASSSYDRAQREITGIFSSQKASRSIGRADIPYRAEVGPDFRTDFSGESLGKVHGLSDLSLDLLRRAATTTHFPEEIKRALKQTSTSVNTEKLHTVETRPMQMPSRPENTPLGRATIESAENSRLVLQRMDGLAAVVGGLNETLVTEVLPSWMKKAEHDQRGARAAFDQAASSLRWTQLAILASIVLTLLATWWQVSVARDIDRENSVQQQKTLDVLREQLASQQKFIEQQAGESERLRKLSSSISQLPATKK